MPRLARYEVLDPGEIQVLHCVQRCVRRAFLCGQDPLTGQSFEHVDPLGLFALGYLNLEHDESQKRTDQHDGGGVSRDSYGTNRIPNPIRSLGCLLGNG